MRRPALPLLVLLAVVLVQAALAAETRPVAYTPADQAAAKAATLKRADFGAGWTGGATKPDLASDNLCPTKRSDLVLTGAARSEFKAQGVLVISQTEVLRSAAMVASEWKRTIGNAAFMACTRRQLVAGEKGVRVVSFKQVPFPKLARFGARYRLVAVYSGAQGTVRVLIDLIALGQGRTEISLVLSTPYADRAAADAAERKLAGILVGRIKT